MTKKNNGNGNGNNGNNDIPLFKINKLTAKTQGQVEYIKAINKTPITFCIGPAGTGKTCIASFKALSFLQNADVGRIVVTRPMLQTDEETGFLPGDLNEKLAPYIKPIYEEFMHYIDIRTINRMIANGLIELCPFAVMRGLNFANSFVIGDECQNASYNQLKMLLTRFSHGSRLVITGDLDQSDLPVSQRGALEYFADILDGMEHVQVIRLTKDDIVRHEVVSQILKIIENHSYEDYKKKTKKGFST